MIKPLRAFLLLGLLIVGTAARAEFVVQITSGQSEATPIAIGQLSPTIA